MRYIVITATILALLLAACDTNDREAPVRETAAAFSERLFNYKYGEALQYATPDSRRAIEFLASNVDTRALEYLHNATDTPSVSVCSVRLLGDTAATTEVAVTNEISPDTIGRGFKLHKHERRYTFSLVRRGNEWLVKMEGLRQNEK